MIWESTPWKHQLLKDADILDRWSKKRTPSEYRSVLIEKKVFISAYAVRKLIESEKLSSSFKTEKLPCIKYKGRSDRVTRLNWHHIDRHYDLEKPMHEHIKACRLINMIIHSYIFTEKLTDDLRVAGFYLTTDFERLEWLWFLSIESIVNLFKRVGIDDFPNSKWAFDSKKGDDYVWNGDGEPPSNVKRKLEKLMAENMARYNPLK